MLYNLGRFKLRQFIFYLKNNLLFSTKIFITQNFAFQRLCQEKYGDIPLCDESPSGGGGGGGGSNLTLYGDYGGEDLIGEIEASEGDYETLQVSEDDYEALLNKGVLVWMTWNAIYTTISIIMGQMFGYWMDR